MSEGDAGYDDWIEAATEGAAFYLACPEGHASLPPRRLCPECGAEPLEQRPLPESGTVETHTVTHVPTPNFEEDAPYAAAIADFGPVRLTGQVVGVPPESVEPGLSVTLEVTTSETTGEPLIALRAR